MATIRTIRQQWPIGQGCLASGEISADGRAFVYVYDCGSENQGALRQAIGSLHPNGNLIDALFLSHLDSDHVNGIDYLCSFGYRVDTIFLPYLSMIDCLIVAGASLSDDSFSWALAEATINPREWFGRRGASQVVMVRRRDIDDEEGPSLPDDFFPDLPHDDKLSTRNALETNHRLGIFELPKFEKKYRGNRQAALSIALSKTLFFLSNLVDAPAWVLVPFVPPLPKFAIDSFIRKVKEDLGFKISYKLSRSRKNMQQLLELLNDRIARQKLKEAYKTLARDHNSVSMCLYSGPLLQPTDKVYWDVLSPPLDYLYYDRRYPHSKSGWIGTGDLTLNLDHHLQAFKKHYSEFSGKISTLLLPHHGSHYNFSADLGTFCSPEISLTSAGVRNKFGHPHPDVLATMRLLGSKIHQVTEKPSSTVIEEIHITR